MDLIGETGPNIPFITFNIGSVFKIVFSFLFILYVAYSFFLALRIKILVQTVFTPWNTFIKRLAFLHLYAVIIVGGLSLFLIIIA
jgi:hypothetical protein